MHRSHKQQRRLCKCVRALSLAAASLTAITTSQAAPLNPLAFNTLGALNVTSGSITINTDTVTISGAVAFNGVTFNQFGGPQMAVFNFTSFNINPGVTINVIGSRPLALLSRNSMSIASGITLSGGNAGFPAAGTAGPAGGYAGGDGGFSGYGPGAGGNSGFNGDGAGAGYGGNGHAADGIAGGSYGNLMSVLQGGSGGAGGTWFGPGGGGGGGAGAIELGAVGILTLTSVVSNGGSGGDTFVGAGGSGAGGGILLHADAYAITTLQALGGDTPGFGGAGGGGRVAIGGGTLTAGQINAMLSSVNGGNNPVGRTGTAGVLTFQPVLALVQSAQTLNVGITPGQTGRTDARIETVPGALTVQSGGTANLVSPIAWGNGSIVTLASGGTLNIANDTTFSSGSTLSWSGDGMVFGAGKTLAIDGGGGTIAGSIGLRDGTTLRITNGGSVNVNNYLDLGSTLTGGANGTMVIDGASSKFTSGVTYTDWGLNAGDSATVTLDHGGAATFSAGLTIAGNGGTARVNLLNGAQLNTASLSIGSSGSNATINIDGGAINNAGDATIQGGAVVNLSNGSLTLGPSTSINDGATVNWSDGTMILGSGKTLSIAGGILSNTTPHSGQALNDSTLSISNGGKYLSSSWVDVGINSYGTLLVEGPNSAIQADTPSIFGNGPSGLAIAYFKNGGVGTFLSLHIGRNGAGASVLANRDSQITAGSMIMGSAGLPTREAFLELTGTLRITNEAQLRARSFLLFPTGTLEIGGTLTMSDNAKLYLSPGEHTVVRVGGLSMSGAAEIELRDNSMIVDYTGPIGSLLSDVRGYLSGGKIISSEADSTHRLGYADNALLHQGSFAGQTFPLGDFSQMLIKFTYAGDANLDGLVDIRDLQLFMQNFNGTNKFWSGGDFDYDGDVDRTDLGFLARNWRAGVGNPLGESFGEAVQSLGILPQNIPEPSIAVTMLGAMIPFLGSRRKRTQLA